MKKFEISVKHPLFQTAVLTIQEDFMRLDRDYGDMQVGAKLQRPGLWKDFLFLYEVLYRNRIAITSVYSFIQEDDLLAFNIDIQRRGLDLAAHIMQFGVLDPNQVPWEVQEDEEAYYRIFKEEGLETESRGLVAACDRRDPLTANALVDAMVPRILAPP